VSETPSRDSDATEASASEAPSDAPTGARRRWTRRGFIALGIGGAAVGVCAPLRFGCYDEIPGLADLSHFSETQGHILLWLVETILPDEADRSAAALVDHVHFIDDYLTGLDPRDVDQLGIVLYLVEQLTLPFGAHLSRFSRLERAERTIYLQGWQTAEMGIRRLAYRSLKTLVFLSYYRSAEAFRTIGYTGPIVRGFPGPPEVAARYRGLRAGAGQSPDAELP
jgi:hypothetical protein